MFVIVADLPVMIHAVEITVVSIVVIIVDLFVMMYAVEIAVVFMVVIIVDLMMTHAEGKIERTDFTKSSNVVISKGEIVIFEVCLKEKTELWL